MKWSPEKPMAPKTPLPRKRRKEAIRDRFRYGKQKARLDRSCDLLGGDGNYVRRPIVCQHGVADMAGRAGLVRFTGGHRGVYCIGHYGFGIPHSR